MNEITPHHSSENVGWRLSAVAGIGVSIGFHKPQSKSKRCTEASPRAKLTKLKKSDRLLHIHSYKTTAPRRTSTGRSREGRGWGKHVVLATVPSKNRFFRMKRTLSNARTAKKHGHKKRIVSSYLPRRSTAAHPSHLRANGVAAVLLFFVFVLLSRRHHVFERAAAGRQIDREINREGENQNQNQNEREGNISLGTRSHSETALKKHGTDYIQ